MLFVFFVILYFFVFWFEIVILGVVVIGVYEWVNMLGICEWFKKFIFMVVVFVICIVLLLVVDISLIWY